VYSDSGVYCMHALGCLSVFFLLGVVFLLVALVLGVRVQGVELY
jgi:hypothetical protein